MHAAEPPKAVASAQVGLICEAILVHDGWHVVCAWQHALYVTAMDRELRLCRPAVCYRPVEGPRLRGTPSRPGHVIASMGRLTNSVIIISAITTRSCCSPSYPSWCASPGVLVGMPRKWVGPVGQLEHDRASLHRCTYVQKFCSSAQPAHSWD